MPPTVVVITGPPGAGKTSVAEGLLSRLDRAVLVRGDEFFESLGDDLISPWRPEADAQNAQMLEAIGESAQRSAIAGHVVIVDAIIGPWLLRRFMSRLEHPVCYVVLRPSLNVAMTRARARDGTSLTDSGPITLIFDDFRDLGEFEQFVIDSTSLDVSATVEVVLERMSDATQYIRPQAD